MPSMVAVGDPVSQSVSHTNPLKLSQSQLRFGIRYPSSLMEDSEEFSHLDGPLAAAAAVGRFLSALSDKR